MIVDHFGIAVADKWMDGRRGSKLLTGYVTGA
jgi:hypothetical protein